MGIFYVRGTFTPPANRKRERALRFLVDAGAFFTVVPRDILASLKIPPIREETVQFADGLGLSVDSRHRRLVPMPLVIVAPVGKMVAS